MNIEEKLKNIPSAPGVYLMKDASGEVLYIGKAKSLRARVRSYFRETGDTRYAVKFLSARVADIDYIVTANEKEALFLEDTLLKQHKPRYNIRLKDSKTYVSIKITLSDEYPRILVTRQIKKDGSRYFGPYPSARAVRETIKFIRRIFPLCVCSAGAFRNRVRPCLDYQMGLCSAPAAGYISREAYRELVDGAVMFLEGRNRELVRMLRERMKEAAAALDFETAGRFRDRLAAIEEMLEEQKVVSHRAIDQDVFAFLRADDSVVIQFLSVRDGRLVGSADYIFHDLGLPDTEIISSFMAQFYRGERYIPDEVIVPVKLDDMEVLGEWLSEKKGRKAAVLAPARGDRVKLLRMAEANAAESLRKRTEQRTTRPDVIGELKTRLRLSDRPERIEAFDISNIGGTLAVGAMVTFVNGEPDKGSYRLFRIKGLEGPDDYAMMEQVLTRRYGGAAAGEGGLRMPGLILMDGGKGQLNIARKVIAALGIEGVELAALAKDKDGEALPGRIQPKGERVYLPNVKDPVLLKEGSRPDLLLRRIRDEVHRFAITYHRKLRSKGVGSVIDSIPGVGGKRKKALFERFGDMEAMKAATIEELKSVPGITESLAVKIKEFLDKQGKS
ncbi:MAG: excinuclease ABC subunit UvrC [Deltaproteobacteria bacterium]|nr:excinuclease ABC subunit UvrC [Deltaproteobacteria bacterium]